MSGNTWCYLNAKHMRSVTPSRHKFESSANRLGQTQQGCSVVRTASREVLQILVTGTFG